MSGRLRPRDLRSVAVAASAALALWAAGCDGVATSPAQQAYFDALEAEWAKIRLAPFGTRFQGDRRVEFSVPDEEGVLQTIAYVERVSCDGTGQFNVLPLQAETAVSPDPATFLMLQERREGFFYRYRDFAVRNVDAFLANFQVLSATLDTIVAGRPCWSVSLARQDEGGRSYYVSFDVQTGLVMACIEFDAEGRALAKLEYQSLDTSPALGGVSFFVPSNAEQWLDPASDDLTAVLGFEPRMPTSVPDGYVPFETSKVEDASGRRWLKLGFTDGIEMLFFLHRVDVSTTGAGASLPTLAGETTRGALDQGEVIVYSAGAVTVAQGGVGDDEFIVVGKLDETALLGMIDSAL